MILKRKDENLKTRLYEMNKLNACWREKKYIDGEMLPINQARS